MTNTYADITVGSIVDGDVITKRDAFDASGHEYVTLWTWRVLL